MSDEQVTTPAHSAPTRLFHLHISLRINCIARRLRLSGCVLRVDAESFLGQPDAAEALAPFGGNLPSKSKMKRPRERPEEIRAAAILAAELGATTSPLDDEGLNSFAGYEVHVPKRDIGVLEVTTHGDRVRASLAAAMDRRAYEFPRASLTRFWSLYLPPIDAEEHLAYSDVVRNLDDIVIVLGVLEAREQWEFGGPYRDQPYEGSILLRLGVESGFASPIGKPGVFFLPPGDGGASGPSAVVAAAVEEANKADNLHKLKKATGDGVADSRHLFVWIAGSQMVPYLALLDGALPQEAPALPQPITDLWIGGQFRSGEVVWHWNGSTWTEVVTENPGARESST